MSRSVSAPSSVTKTSPCWNGDIVPGSTLMYGSNFWRATVRPRETRRRPIEAAAIPLPSEETTPPVTKMKRVRGRDSGIGFWRASLERAPADSAQQKLRGSVPGPSSGVAGRGLRCQAPHPPRRSGGLQQLLGVAARRGVRLVGAEHPHEL